MASVARGSDMASAAEEDSTLMFSGRVWPLAFLRPRNTFFLVRSAIYRNNTYICAVFQITMLTPRHNDACTDLEQIFIDKQIANPGHWDGKLLNWNGQPYHEASMGLNPLRQGYSICAPYKST
jgi:hypothetical protein